MAKLKTYTVRCRKTIADEMMRYERSTLVSQTDEQCPERWVGTRLEPDYTTYLFTIQCNGGPIVDRWRSFGVSILSVS